MPPSKLFLGGGPLPRQGPPVLLDGDELVSDGFHWENSAEGGIASTTVTTQNSGGASGQPWSSVTLTGGTIIYDSGSTRPLGALAYRIAQSSPNVVRVEWLFPSQRQLFWRSYICLELLPTASARIAVLLRSDLTAVGDVRINTSGNVLINDGAGALIATSATVLKQSRWYRLEALYSTDPSGSLLYCRIFTDPNSAIAAETISGGAVSGEMPGVIRIGQSNAPATPFILDFDNIGITNQGWLGPLDTAPAPWSFAPSVSPWGRPGIGTARPGPRVLAAQNLPVTPEVTITVDTPGAVGFSGATDLALVTGWATELRLDAFHPQGKLRGPHSGPPVLRYQTVPDFTSGDVTISPTPGAATWAGATDVLLRTGWSGQLPLNTFHPQGKLREPHAGPPVLVAQAFPDFSAGSITIVPTPGALTWTGQAVALTITIAPNPGAITWTGSTVSLTNTITPTAGALTIAGQAIGLTVLLSLIPGAIVFTGSNVLLPPVKGAALVSGVGVITAAGVILRTIIPETRVVATWSEDRSLRSANNPGRSW